MSEKMKYSIFRAQEQKTERFFNKEPKPIFRNEFDRDRDRILYSKEFRRLSGKTQVFVAGFDDNLRTRLTHTIEVAQIARTISKKLELQDSLVEAISLGHDVGHTPFGHSGERCLNFIMNSCHILKQFHQAEGELERLAATPMGFKHNLQSIRVVCDLERIDPAYTGLNLTNYTLWGIAHHSKTQYKKCDYYNEEDKYCLYLREHQRCATEGELFVSFYDQYLEQLPSSHWTIEAIIVAWADEIAQRHHDTEDGYLSGVLTRNQIEEIFYDCFRPILKKEDKKSFETLTNSSEEMFISSLSRFIVNFYVSTFIRTTLASLEEIAKKFGVKDEDAWKSFRDQEDSYERVSPYIGFSKEFIECDKKFQKVLYSRIIHSHEAQLMDGKSSYIIRSLFSAYLENPQQLPSKTVLNFMHNLQHEDLLKKIEGYDLIKKVGYAREELSSLHATRHGSQYNNALMRTICDYIAGMTDDFALDCFDALFSSRKMKNW